MKLIKLIILLAVLVCLVSCTKENEDTKKDESIVKKDIAELQAVQEPVYVSPIAKEAFLEPIENFSWEREYAPEKVMLHFTSAVVLSKENPYDMDLIRQIFVDNEVSIHYIVDRDGTVYCYMPEDRAAWHAGVGTYEGDEKYTNSMNKYSIGIEIVAMGSQNDMSQYLSASEYASLEKSLIGFTDEQYISVKALVEDICQRYGIDKNRQNIISHSEYNPDKTDVGELFDWDRVIE